MIFLRVDVLLHAFVEWVDGAGCNISQGVVLFSDVWNSLEALNVDELVGVDLQTTHLQLLFVAFNAETGKCEQRLMLQQLVQALGPARGETFLKIGITLMFELFIFVLFYKQCIHEVVVYAG